MPIRFADAPVLVALHEYWQRKRGPRPMPDRRDIDPLELGPGLLPHVALLELEDGAARVRYRLMGTAIVERLGLDPTGLYLEDVLSGSYREFIHSLCRDVYTHRCPVYAESRFRWDIEGHMDARRLYLPLTAGGDDVVIVLVGQVFHVSQRIYAEPIRALIGRATIEQSHDILPVDEP